MFARQLCLRCRELCLLGLVLAAGAAPGAAEAAISVALSRSYDVDQNVTSGYTLVGEGFDWQVVWWYIDHDTGEFDSVVVDGNPSPDGQSSGLAEDAELILEAIKKYGGSPLDEVDPLDNPYGRGLVESGRIPGAEIDPWDAAGAFFDDIAGGGGAGGGYDPTVPLGEQLPSAPGKDDDEDNHGGGQSQDHGMWDGHYIADPELINPVLLELLIAAARSK